MGVDAVEFGVSLAIAVAGAAAAFVLRAAWAKRDGPRGGYIVLAWALFAAGVVVAAWAFNAVRGPFIAASLLSAGALTYVVSNLQWREARVRAPREIALEPSDRPSRAWRGWLRGVLAGPLGGVAAMGVGLAIAVFSPGDQQTRIVTGGLFVPILWAGGMAWTLSDDKILRATAVLSGVALVTFTAAALKGFS